MTETLNMALFSRKAITERLARRQIGLLSCFRDGLMRPDKWSEFEPIRTVFDPENVEQAVQCLSKHQGNFFYRKGRHLSGEIWNLKHPPDARFPGPLFCNLWTGRFGVKWADRIGLELVEGFASEMFREMSADFGFLTTDVDLKAKNTDSSSYSYQGLNPDIGIPGLYWINFFSDALADWLGLSTLSDRLAKLEKPPGGGVVLKFCKSPEACREFEVLQKQDVTIQWLGSGRFFDIRQKARKCETPNWAEVAIV